ncbi:MAG: fatty acid desaturase [bacterium]|nr:fatty acid desaturase [bacterium]
MLTLALSWIVTQVALFSTTIYLHRTATHRAMVLHPVVVWMFRFVLWITTGQKTKEWVAVHRKHHASPDKWGDPHSPLLEGFWSVQFGNVFHYVRALRKDRNIVAKYASDIQNNRWDTLLFNHRAIGLGLGIAILCVILGIKWGLIAAGIHTVMYMCVLTSSINGLCHYTGSKNFANSAYNQPLLALITGGEGLHNNHHGFPRSPKLSWRPSEIDPAWPIVKLLMMLGLAWQPHKTIEETMTMA